MLQSGTSDGGKVRALAPAPDPQHYNAMRPHSSLDYLTPNEYVKKLQPTSTHARAAVLN